MPLGTPLSYLGIALEVTKGTGVAASNFIPVDTISPVDNQMYLEDKGLRGSMADLYGETSGVLFSEFEFAGQVFGDGIGWPLVGILGADAVTGAGAPYTHTISLLNTGDGQAPAYSLTDYYGYSGTHSRRFVGQQFSELALKFAAEGMLEYSAKSSGFGSALVAQPSSSFSTVTPTPGWEVAISIGGGSVSYVESGEVSLKRPVSVIHTADGTPAPYKIWQGPLSVDGKLTVVIDDDTELLRYLNNTQPALVIDSTHGASTALVEVKLTMTKCAYTAGKIVRGKDYVEVEIDFNAIANSTDAGASGGLAPCKAIVQNAKASGTYI